jgi:integrase
VDENGNKKCRKQQVENKSAGLALVKKWIREIEEEGEEYFNAEKATFEQLAEKYRDQRLTAPEYRDGKKVSGLRDWEGARNRLKPLIQHFGKKRIRSIKYTDIEKYRNQRITTQVIFKKKDGTVVKTKDRSIGDVHRSLALLKAVFTYAVENEWLTRNPFSKGKSLIAMAQEVPRERVLSTDEQRRLLQACQNDDRRHIYPLILTALDSGCRRGELLKLRWRDVDLEKGTLRVIATNAKTNRPRVIDLEAVTLAELKTLAKITGAFADELVFGIKTNFTRAWRSALKEAKITGARFHDLRATAITHWLVRGMQTAFAMQRSGHSDPRMFMRYVRMCEEIQQKQREQLREWELAAGLAELAANRSTIEAEPERSEMIH